jgi:perosamine synthetase
MDRRVFLAASAALGTASAETAQPALLGGKAVRQERFSAWPLANQVEEKALMQALRSGKWNRNTAVPRFEEEYAKLTGTAKCLAVANGTSALLIALNALGIGAGDEVIVPPYTFIATINTVLAQHALPVFVDTDPETFQIDPRKIEAAITPRTALILPVHMGGNAANLDAILEVARKHKIPVLEDAAQAHLAEWRGKKVGSVGSMGCFSFQASKNLNSGEGGAIVSQQP